MHAGEIFNNSPGLALALRLNVIDPNWIPMALNWSVLDLIQRTAMSAKNNGLNLIEYGPMWLGPIVH